MSHILTQRLFARTVSFTASKNCSTLGAGMHNRSAPILIRNAFSCGRKRRIDPSSFLCALRPSSNPCRSFTNILEHSQHNGAKEDEGGYLWKPLFQRSSSDYWRLKEDLGVHKPDHSSTLQLPDSAQLAHTAPIHRLWKPHLKSISLNTCSLLGPVETQEHPSWSQLGPGSLCWNIQCSSHEQTLPIINLKQWWCNQ